MENLTTEDFKSLINFYRQRINELEFTALQNQLIVPRIMRENENYQSVNSSLQAKVNILIEENEDLKSKIALNKKTKNKKQG
jgi:hypothetical protein